MSAIQLDPVLSVAKVWGAKGARALYREIMPVPLSQQLANVFNMWGDIFMSGGLIAALSVVVLLMYPMGKDAQFAAGIAWGLGTVFALSHLSSSRSSSLSFIGVLVLIPTIPMAFLLLVFGVDLYYIRYGLVGMLPLWISIAIAMRLTVLICNAIISAFSKDGAYDDLPTWKRLRRMYGNDFLTAAEQHNYDNQRALDKHWNKRLLGAMIGLAVLGLLINTVSLGGAIIIWLVAILGGSLGILQIDAGHNRLKKSVLARIESDGLKPKPIYSCRSVEQMEKVLGPLTEDEKRQARVLNFGLGVIVLLYVIGGVAFSFAFILTIGASYRAVDAAWILVAIAATALAFTGFYLLLKKWGLPAEKRWLKGISERTGVEFG